MKILKIITEDEKTRKNNDSIWYFKVLSHLKKISPNRNKGPKIWTFLSTIYVEKDDQLFINLRHRAVCFSCLMVSIKKKEWSIQYLGEMALESKHSDVFEYTKEWFIPA